MRYALIAALLLFPARALADGFDNYTNDVLALAPKAEGAVRIAKITPAQMFENMRSVPNVNGCLLVVRTHDDRWAKLVVLTAREKINAATSQPIVLIDRFVTYRGGEERAVSAQGQNIHLFEGFRFNLSTGQVVPDNMPCDIRVQSDRDDIVLVPSNGSQIYLITKALPQAAAKKTDKVVVGDTFEPKYVNGVYKLYDDGRRAGELTLHVNEEGNLDGFYFSEKDGKKYDVSGKMLTPPHKLQFTITFPASIQTFDGWLFTGDAAAITGSSRLQDREAGFYALRKDNTK